MSGNFLILMSDEHQARALGCAGHPLVQTPHLDALAAKGTRFSNAYTPSPICVPARASFATGLYPHQTRLWDNAMPYDGTIPGWGHALQARGVPVESIGKLHYRAEEDPAGFDAEHIPMMVAGGVGMVWASIRKEDERIMGEGRMLGDYIGPGQSKYTEYDAAVTDRTIEWLQERAAGDDKRPWCLYVGLVAPHFPLVCPPEFYDLYPHDQLPEPKLHPRDGHVRHPWVEKQNAFMDSEAKFEGEGERKAAIASYLGLTSWLDHNVGRILEALGAAGFGEDTTVVYSSDHGDNLGARALWGKSNLYQESVAVPMIMAGPDVPQGVCDTPVSLLDLSATIAGHFGAGIDGADGLRNLREVAGAPEDPERVIFSEYHAAGAVSGAFMLRKGRWKYHHYVGFEPELFDLETDPEETRNLADEPTHAAILAQMRQELHTICDPEATDAQAFADQADLIEKHGGREAALKLGAPGATPPPSTEGSMMKLTILGSGSPEAYARRASTGYLLEIGEDKILFDCGGGVVDNLVRSGRLPSDITHLFFTHLHTDHMMDYARLVHAAWDEGGAPIKVWGPKPIARQTELLFGKSGVLSPDLIARTELVPSQQVWVARGGSLPRQWPSPEVTEITPGFSYEGNGWVLKSCEVPHAQPAFDCMAFSVEAGGKKFVYSGDAGICENLSELQRDADLLIHWCYRLSIDDIHPAIAEFSPTPADIAKSAQASNVKKLLISHFRIHMDSEGGHASANAELAEHFSGPAEIAEDLNVYEI